MAGNYTPGMVFFEGPYHGSPPWDIGRAQLGFVALEESGEVAGDVLDVGCRTGENALFPAGRGHNVWRVDSAPSASQIAWRKAEEWGVLFNIPGPG